MRMSVAAVTTIAALFAVHGQMVETKDCQPVCCTCNDLPLLNALAANTQAALGVYVGVMNDPRINNPGWNAQGEAARQLGTIPADPLISNLIATCNSSTLGQAHYATVLMSKCYCDNVCEIGPNSTLLHERTHMRDHALTLVLYGYGGFPALFVFTPSKLAIASEIHAHENQINYLNDRLTNLDSTCAHGAAGNTVDPSCKPLGKRLGWNSSPSPSSPKGLIERCVLLASRILHGVL
jgi:hypothetical protein